VGNLSLRAMLPVSEGRHRPAMVAHGIGSVAGSKYRLVSCFSFCMVFVFTVDL